MFRQYVVILFSLDFDSGFSLFFRDRCLLASSPTCHYVNPFMPNMYLLEFTPSFRVRDASFPIIMSIASPDMDVDFHPHLRPFPERVIISIKTTKRWSPYSLSPVCEPLRDEYRIPSHRCVVEVNVEGDVQIVPSQHYLHPQLCPQSYCLKSSPISLYYHVPLKSVEFSSCQCGTS